MTIEIHTSQELLNSFRPRDRKHVEIPRGMTFPLKVDHYLTWTEPSGVRVFLVFKRPEWIKPIGIAFRRDQQGSFKSPQRMCDWCHAYGPSDQVALLTVSVNSKKRVGVLLCIDLGCMQKIEMIANMTGVRIEKLAADHCERMTRFFNEALELHGNS